LILSAETRISAYMCNKTLQSSIRRNATTSQAKHIRTD